LKSIFKIGLGYDVHQFDEGRKLILGGVLIPFNKGLQGHSDADALLHSITDALLGALALGNIGTFFPESNPEFKNAESKIFLERAVELVRENQFEIGNIDSTIILDSPKLNPFIPQIRKNISNILLVDISQVSVKATTSEGMGFVGEGKGIKVMSIALLIKANG